MKRKTKKRTLTREYLVRATYSYLERFATTEKNLAAVLDRKVRKRLPEEGDVALYAEAKQWIVEIVKMSVDKNLVNDRSFATARTKSLIRGGNSKRNVAQKLLAKGVGYNMAEEVIQKLAEEHEDLDFIAAVKYIKKRRFGAFSTRHDGSALVEKEMGSLCRAGFSYSLAARILRMSQDELDEALYQIEI